MNVPKNSMDSAHPAGFVYQLLPVIFPGLRPTSSKAMKVYYISETGSSGTVSGRSINLTVPYSADLSSLTADFYHNGGKAFIGNTEQISRTTKNSYSSSLVYTVQARNGTSQDYTVRTSKGTLASNSLLSFSLALKPELASYTGIITGNLVNVYLPFGTDITGLTAIFSHDGKKVQVAGADQTSGKTVQNFSNPIQYSVISETGTKQDYTVSVSVSASDSKEIKAFWLDSIQATFNDTNILVNIPEGKSMNDLMTDFIYIGDEVLIGGKPVKTGEYSGDYTDSVDVTVKAKDGSSKKYTVFTYQKTEYSVGGFVTGLAGGKSLSIRVNGTGNLKINANGTFYFSTGFSSGSTYSVSVITQPSLQFCTVSNGSGTVSGKVSNIMIECTSTPGSAPPNFTDLGSQTVRDNNTGLIWMKCSMSNVSGVPLSGSTCTGGTLGSYKYCREQDNDCSNGTTTGSYGILVTAGFSGSYPGSHGTVYDTVTAGADHYTAYKACSDANTVPSGGFTGRTDWRVPSIDELMSIVDFSVSSAPFINSVFPSTAGGYWVSRGLLGSHAWAMDFNSGYLNSIPKNSAVPVRCVSGP